MTATPVDHSVDCACGPDGPDTDPAIADAHFTQGMAKYINEMTATPTDPRPVGAVPPAPPGEATP